MSQAPRSSVAGLGFNFLLSSRYSQTCDAMMVMMAAIILVLPQLLGYQYLYQHEQCQQSSGAHHYVIVFFLLKFCVVHFLSRSPELRDATDDGGDGDHDDGDHVDGDHVDGDHDDGDHADG